MPALTQKWLPMNLLGFGRVRVAKSDKANPAPILGDCVRCHMTKALKGTKPKPSFNPNTKRPGELGEPIRPFVVRPRGLAVHDHKTIELANAEMEELHALEVAKAWHEKLKLLLRHYNLGDRDWRGLALKLAIEHEPGFQVDRQLATLPSLGLRVQFIEKRGDAVRPSDEELHQLLRVIRKEKKKFGGSDRDALVRLRKYKNWDLVIYPDFSGGVHVTHGRIVDNPAHRPTEWSVERLDELLEAVEAEKKKFGLNDRQALERLASHKKWAPPANRRSKSTRGDFDAWVLTLRRRLYEARDLKRKFRRASRATPDDFPALRQIVRKVLTGLFPHSYRRTTIVG